MDYYGATYRPLTLGSEKLTLPASPISTSPQLKFSLGMGRLRRWEFSLSCDSLLVYVRIWILEEGVSAMLMQKEADCSHAPCSDPGRASVIGALFCCLCYSFLLCVVKTLTSGSRSRESLDGRLSGEWTGALE
jgi:hypothetical protein